jgi:hypothetical protein
MQCTALRSSAKSAGSARASLHKKPQVYSITIANP